MNLHIRILLWSLAPLVLAAADPLHAQISLDGTLPNGRTDTLVGPDYAITEDLGYRNGINLFHSFQQFDVAAGQSATFSAVLPTANVIARVTSFDPMTGQAMPQGSQIDGALRFDASLGNANLFFVNPAGIVFGPSASVAIMGGTFVSTADHLRFDDPAGTTLDSTSPNVDWNGLMLQTASPAAFGFLGGDPAAGVEIAGDPSSFRTLALTGASFSVAAGDVDVSQNINAPGSLVQVAAVGSTQVEVPVAFETLDLTGADPSTWGDVTIRRSSGATSGAIRAFDPINTAASTGTIVIRGGRFDVAGSGVLVAAGGRLASTGAALDVEVAGDASIRQSAQVGAIGLGTRDFGSVRIAAGGDMRVEGSTVTSQASGTGTGGGIDLSANRFDVIGGGQIVSSSNVGFAGDLRMAASGVATVDGSQILSSTAASNKGGSISLAAAGLDILRGGSVSATSSASAAPGSIAVTTGFVDVRGLGSTISTTNTMQTPGDPTLAVGGDVTIDSGAGPVTLRDRGSITTRTQGTRAGGSLDLQASALDVQDGGRIGTSTTGSGAGGDVTIVAPVVSVRRGPAAGLLGLITTEVRPGASGAGGSIDITTDSLTVLEGGQISTTTEGAALATGDGGAGGDLTIHANGGTVLLAGGHSSAGTFSPSGLFARSGFQSGPTIAANGGSIAVDAVSIDVIDGAEVSASALGAGDAGSVRVTAVDALRIAGDGTRASTVAAVGTDGDGGDVTLGGRSIALLRGGNASVTTKGSGTGGLLTVHSGSLVVSGANDAGTSPSGLAAESLAAGPAGGIDITLTETLTVSEGGAITARSRGDGPSGSVTIRDAALVQIESGGEIRASATGPATGGSITIDVPGSVVLTGGTISASSNTGAGGSVTLLADQSVALSEGAEISARAAGAQPAGDVSITSAGTVTLYSSSRITAEATGAGNAGSITIDAGQQLDLANSAITTQAAVGLGGNIDITASDRIYLLASAISTSVKGGSGSGGNITIDPQFVILNQSQIVAQADAGAGGNISITTNNFVPSGDSLVSASSRLGIDGTVAVSTPEAQLAGELAALPENLLDATAMLREACEVRDAPVGSFSVRTVRPLPPPDAPFDPEAAEAAVCAEP